MYLCPVCGYDKLIEEPYDLEKNPSYEICPCCGFEFGFDDDSKGISWEKYRRIWISEGCKWFDSDKRPPNWNAKVQLNNVKNY